MITSATIFDEAQTNLDDPMRLDTPLTWLHMVDDPGFEVRVQLPNVSRSVVLEPWQPLCFGCPVEGITLFRPDSTYKLPGAFRVRFGHLCPPGPEVAPARLVRKLSNSVEAPAGGAWTQLGDFITYLDTSSDFEWHRYPAGVFATSTASGDHSLRIGDVINNVPMPMATRSATGGGPRWASRVYFSDPVQMLAIQVKSNTGTDLVIDADLYERHEP